MMRITMVVTTVLMLLFSSAVIAEEPEEKELEARYVVTDLGHKGGMDGAWWRENAFINNRGQVVWLSSDPSDEPSERFRSFSLFLWQKGKKKTLYNKARVDSHSNHFRLTDFNDSGQIAGWLERSTPIFSEEALIQEKKGWPKPVKWDQPVIWDTEGNVHYIGEEFKSVVWQAPFLTSFSGKKKLRFSPEHDIVYLTKGPVINDQGLIVCKGTLFWGRWRNKLPGLFVTHLGSKKARFIDPSSAILRAGKNISFTTPIAINNSGQVVGAHAFIWWKEEDRLESIDPTIRDSRDKVGGSTAVDINDRNQVVGADYVFFYEIEGVKLVVTRYNLPLNIYRAWVWEDGKKTFLPNIDPREFSEKSQEHHSLKKDEREKRPVITASRPSAINNRGQIVGEIFRERLCVEDESPIIKRPDGTRYMYAKCYLTQTTATSAVIWENGEIKELNSLVPPDTPHLVASLDINDYGQIIAVGTSRLLAGKKKLWKVYREKGKAYLTRNLRRLYLLTPISLLDGKSVAELDLPGKPKMETEEKLETAAKSD